MSTEIEYCRQCAGRFPADLKCRCFANGSFSVNPPEVSTFCPLIIRGDADTPDLPYGKQLESHTIQQLADVSFYRFARLDADWSPLGFRFDPEQVIALSEEILKFQDNKAKVPQIEKRIELSSEPPLPDNQLKIARNAVAKLYCSLLDPKFKNSGPEAINLLFTLSQRHTGSANGICRFLANQRMDKVTANTIRFHLSSAPSCRNMRETGEMGRGDSQSST